MSNRLTVWWEGRITGCLYLGPSADHLRTGAALNAVQIAESLGRWHLKMA